MLNGVVVGVILPSFFCLLHNFTLSLVFSLVSGLFHFLHRSFPFSFHQHFFNLFLLCCLCRFLSTLSPFPTHVSSTPPFTIFSPSGFSSLPLFFLLFLLTRLYSSFFLNSSLHSPFSFASPPLLPLFSGTYRVISEGHSRPCFSPTRLTNTLHPTPHQHAIRRNEEVVVWGTIEAKKGV